MTGNYLETKGRIFDIQKFSTHDGPGIRTIVFLKGCILRCRWCCNPESQNYKIEEMNQNGKVRIMGEDVTVADVMKKVAQDLPYYRRSGGGITLSGGETLLQKEFAYALLTAAKENGLTTAIESTGFAPFETIEKLLPVIDVFLMDIKHINSNKHKEYTSQPNELILENAIKIAKSAKKLIIRVPVIPTFNDTEDEIRQIAQFTKKLGTVEEIHLLPYHRLGEDKYGYLGREYTLSHISSNSSDKMQTLKSVCESQGLKCQIGG